MGLSEDCGVLQRRIIVRCPTPGAMPPSKVEHLPCSVPHEGYAKFKSYFKPRQLDLDAEKKETLYEAEFRGVLLQGKRIALPEGVHGIVFRESPSGECYDAFESLSDTENEAGSCMEWAAESRFGEVDYWKFDEAFHASDLLSRACEFVDIARAAHSE